MQNPIVLNLQIWDDKVTLRPKADVSHQHANLPLIKSCSIIVKFIWHTEKVNVLFLTLTITISYKRI